jgi:2-polyprenyl-6-methoxyphenol hydroxylase-like FAD-dependent oxidoreductase
MPDPQQRVLIIGAGAAGSVLAYWLSRASAPYSITVVERSSTDQRLGQGIEIEQPALRVVEAMGILEELEGKRTGEKGFMLVDGDGKECARFDAGRGISPTGDLEIMRGDLTDVLYRAAVREGRGRVRYVFETTILGLEVGGGECVVAEFRGRGEGGDVWREEFDFVVGADGFNSRTRKLVMPEEEEGGKCFRRVGAYAAWFSIPKMPQDWPYSKACQYPGRRIIWTRPVSEEDERTSVYLIHLADDVPAIREANAAGDRVKQKEAFAALYDHGGLGWESKRVVEQMMKSENFYSDDMTQVRLSKWSKGRVALVGDAAWAPTAFTGQGNQLAIIGAWVLAQEMTRDRSVHAFENYERRLRGYVTECQHISLGGRGPYLFAPQTTWGIWVSRLALRFAAAINWFIDWMMPADGSNNGSRPKYDEKAFDLQISDEQLTSK